MTEREVLQEVFALIDDGVLVDRSEKPLRPTVTVVGSQRLKDRDEDVHNFVKELRQRYPFARIVVGDKSPVEKAAGTAAVLYGMPFEFVKKGEKGEWDESAEVRDSKVVARCSHVILFDNSARSLAYKRMAERSLKHVSSI